MNLDKVKTREGLLDEIQRIVAEAKEHGIDAAAVLLKGKLQACNDVMRKSNLRTEVADTILTLMIELGAGRVDKKEGTPASQHLVDIYAQQVRIAYDVYFSALGFRPPLNNLPV